ncbi:MAG: CHAT domain-containing protein, partial [Acidobacteriota bacterium]
VLTNWSHREVRGWRLPWSRTLVAFGDPAFSGSPPEGESSSLELGGQWERLPGSRKEVKAIASLIGGASRLYFGEAAQKSQLFREASAPIPLLHLSTHAAAETANPELSRILFSHQPGQDGADYLFLGEVASLDLRRTELVTLSACETARGRWTRGEGVQDLGRAFLMAGAAATVASLWRVADEPTVQFMKQFYFFLTRGNSKAEALRKAKLKFLHSGGRLSQAYFWAPFVLYGNGSDPVSVPLSWGAFLLAGGGLLSLLTAGCWYFRRSRSRPGP